MHNHCLLYMVYDYYLLNVDYTTSEFQNSMHLEHAVKYSDICQGCASTKVVFYIVSQTKIHTWTCVMVSHTQVMNPDFLCCSPYYSHKQAGQQHKVIKQTETNTCSQICHAITTLTTHSETTSNTACNYINFKVKFSTLRGASSNLFTQ